MLKNYKQFQIEQSSYKKLKMTEVEEQKSISREQLKVAKKGWTNNLFKIEKNNKVVYYIPAYLRLKVKNIVSLDLFTLTGQVNCTFIMSILYGHMEEELVEYLQKSMEIAFRKSDALALNDENLEVIKKKDQSKKLLTFTVRKVIAARLEGQIFWSPFERVKFIISLTLRTLRTIINDKEYLFKFNLMDCDGTDIKFSLSEESRFGVYKVADRQLQVEYTNEYTYFSHEKATKGSNRLFPLQKSYQAATEKKSNQKLIIEEEIEPLSSRHKIRNFQNAHFVLPVYKKPNPSILTIYFPLLLLGIINIGIFYQDVTLSGKVTLNIAAVLVSFIALIPTVRANTAISPVVTLTEILVFIEAFTTLLTLVHMIKYRNETDFQEELSEDGLVIASIVITSVVAFCIFLMILLHKFRWKNQYHRKEQIKSFKFDHTKWYNNQCDRYFSGEVSGMQECIVESLITRLTAKDQ